MKTKTPTIAYYEALLGQQNCLSDNNTTHFIHSQERNIQQPGFSSRFDIYCWVQPGKIVISYGDAAQPQINQLKQAITANHGVNEIKSLLSNIYSRETKHNIKYIFKGGGQPSQIKATTITDYIHYRNFFLSCFPGSKIDWLEEYFIQMVQFGHCVGIYEDDCIVSCTDGPSMPYMTDKVQEIGINTLPKYKGRGYATIACVKMAENIVANKKVPQWSTSSSNTASQKLAEKVGFDRLADVLSLTL